MIMNIFMQWSVVKVRVECHLPNEHVTSVQRNPTLYKRRVFTGSRGADFKSRALTSLAGA